MLNTLREGKVLAPEVTVEVIQNAMESSGNYKFLIDGFPQNEESRIAFDRIVSFFYYIIYHEQGNFFHSKRFYSNQLSILRHDVKFLLSC